MAIPSAQQCKLQISFNMVDKTVTVSTQTVLETWALLTYTPSGATLVNPLGDSVDITDINVEDGTGTFSQTWPAAVDVDGKVINGAYDIKIPSLLVNDDTTPVTYTDVDSSYTLNYVVPTVTITHTLKCSNPASFVSTDETNWNQYNPNGSTVVPDSETNYQHNLNYPVESDGAGGVAPPTETTDISITRGPEEFFNGVQTSFVTKDLVWIFADGTTVSDTVKNTKWSDVDCDNQMCAVTCGLTKLWRAWMANKDTTQGNLNRDLMVTAAAEAIIGYLNINCGDPQTGNEIAAAIKIQIGPCCDGCSGPADGTPVTGY